MISFPLQPFNLLPKPLHLFQRRLRGRAPLPRQYPLHPRKPTRKLVVRPAQTRLRIEPQLARQIGHHEQHVPQLVGQARGVSHGELRA
jgi:hypothetical protein